MQCSGEHRLMIVNGLLNDDSKVSVLSGKTDRPIIGLQNCEFSSLFAIIALVFTFDGNIVTCNLATSYDTLSELLMQVVCLVLGSVWPYPHVS